MGFYNLKNRTERLLKTNKNNEKFHASNFITKTTNSFQNFSQNLSQKDPSFPFVQISVQFHLGAETGPDTYSDLFGQWRHFRVFVVDFEYISRLFLEFQFSTFSK